jgi:hypothetical protein
MVQAVAVFNVIMLTMQFFKHDQLLNFGGPADQFGGVGQHMRMGSFATILTSLLIFASPWWCIFGMAVGLLCKSTWTLVAVASGMFFINKKVFLAFILIGIIAIAHFHKIHEQQGTEGRLPVWKKTVELSNRRPFWGVGIGTYKLVFAPLSKMEWSVWRTAHNCWLEILFETGRPGLLFVAIMTLWLFFVLWFKQDYLCMAGLTIICVDMIVHFPTRMMNTVPLIVLFLALCEQRIKYGCNIFKDISS